MTTSRSLGENIFFVPLVVGIEELLGGHPAADLKVTFLQQRKYKERPQCEIAEFGKASVLTEI